MISSLLVIFLCMRDQIHCTLITGSMFQHQKQPNHHCKTINDRSVFHFVCVYTRREMNNNITKNLASSLVPFKHQLLELC